MNTIKMKHKQYLEIKGFPEQLITKTRSHPHVNVYDPADGSKVGTIMICKGIDSLVKIMNLHGLKTEEICGEYNRYASVCGCKVNKVDNRLVVVIRGRTEDELTDRTIEVRKELSAMGIKYDKKCKFLCIT